MRSGLDRLLADDKSLARLRSRRLGLLCHAAALSHRGEHIALALRKAGLSFQQIFSPEHGLWGAAQDMQACPSRYDPIVEAPVYSLYGDSLASLEAQAESLDRIDSLIVDLQDVGARYYTYVYSALLLSQACMRRAIEVFILDRPNPINAMSLEGGLIEAEYHSFVGMKQAIARHGMTMAELIALFCAQDGFDSKGLLHIFALEGYERSAYFDQLGLPWAQPSPNMPSLDTAIVYPGLCLLEGTNLSEGRGTTRPFEIFGAPWLDVHACAQALDLLKLPGCFFRPLEFLPQFQKHANTLCRGFQIHVYDRQAFRPLLTGLAILSVVSALSPDFAWRKEAYEFVQDRLAIDLLIGSKSLRQRLEAQENPYHLLEEMEAKAEGWRQERRQYLLYP